MNTEPKKGMFFSQQTSFPKKLTGFCRVGGPLDTGYSGRLAVAELSITWTLASRLVTRLSNVRLNGISRKNTERNLLVGKTVFFFFFFIYFIFFSKGSRECRLPSVM